MVGLVVEWRFDRGYSTPRRSPCRFRSSRSSWRSPPLPPPVLTRFRRWSRPSAASHEMAVEQGMREAFLANLADDAVVFQPLPVNGRRVWSARPRSAATLMWEPRLRGGRRLRRSRIHDRPVGVPSTGRRQGQQHASTVTSSPVWRRAPSGAWKVAVDLGAAHERAEPGIGSGAFTAGPAHGPAPSEDRYATATQELRAAERSFAKAASEAGFAAALAGQAATDARFNRDGMTPAVGRDSIRAAVAADTARARWTPQESAPRVRGDLASRLRRPRATRGGRRATRHQRVPRRLAS